MGLPSSLISKLASILDLLIPVFQTIQTVQILSFSNVLKSLQWLPTALGIKSKTLSVTGKAFQEVPLIPFSPRFLPSLVSPQAELLLVPGKHHDLSHLLLFANIVSSP